MNTTIIHVSDIHFRENWQEDQDVVLKEFFVDLEIQVAEIKRQNLYIVFSGDFVLKGGETALYDKFFEYFDKKLNELGIGKDKRICVPGNHDISQGVIESDLKNHDAIISQNLDEGDFNDYTTNVDKNILLRKFENYKSFEKKFAGFGILNDKMTGMGWIINEDIGIYCLNTAFCSSGGVKKAGKEIDDEARLAINTRDLQAWNNQHKLKTKILVMHHPTNWMTKWSGEELKKIIRKDFSLCLSGHVHNQDLLHSIHTDSPLIECSSPPLLTNKHGDLGYSIITVNPASGVNDIAYRQWTKHRKFVSGVDFSNTDNGVITITGAQERKISYPNKRPNDLLGNYLSKRLDEALASFPAQPVVWIEPILRHTSEVNANSHETEPPVNLSEIISNPKSTVIKSLPQFGLTCLSYYLCKEAWLVNNSYWVYLNAVDLKPHTVMKAIKNELDTLGCDVSDISCIILDSWGTHDKDSVPTLEKLCTLFEEIPIIVMETIDSAKFLESTSQESMKREFETLYLWSLTRNDVRKLVTKYNDVKYVGEIDSVITKVVADLEVLNLPRTPLNCLTLLKASEIDFDESPVNRTEIIKRILFLLFNMDGIPTYKTRPDLKDCEYVLGYFCETLIKENRYIFTRDEFLQKLNNFCKEKIISLEVQIVFDILFANHILINRGTNFCFRFTYWIHYFAAQRMHQDKDFAKYILDDIRYASYPEIIEFYTGIDRRRDDALSILLVDIQNVYELVEEKLGFPEELNPYKHAQWRPSGESFKKMENEIADGVKESKLPVEIKDLYADSRYDRTRPYHQTIETILREYSLNSLIQLMRAGARALRNSDYANPEVKRQLLQVIFQSWSQVSKVIMVLSKTLADEGRASFDGFGFFLVGSFGESPEERLGNILKSIPANVVAIFKDDLYSHKMGQLLFDKLIHPEITELERHYIQLLLINQRPPDWKSKVQDYISSISKNSFYLYDINRALLTQYKYSYASQRTLDDMKYLIKMTIAKHEGSKNPGIQAVNKISDNVLPPRNED